MAEGSQLAATVAGEVLDIPLALIEIKDRQRPVDPVWAAALGKIMTAEGGPNRNRTAIEVCRLPGRSDFLLVTGGHRTEGARLEGWSTVRGIVVSADALDRRRAEISENLWRADLAPIDRASAVAELVHIQKVAAGVDPAKSGSAIAAEVRWSESLKNQADDASLTMRLAYGWADDVAEQIGLSRQTIYRDLELHRGLRPDVVEQLRGLPVAKNAGQLRTLAKLPEADQRAVAAMIAQGDAATVAEAQAMRSQTPRVTLLDDQEKFYRRQIALWSRLSAKSKSLAFAEIFARDPSLPAHLKALLKPLKSGTANDLELEGLQPRAAGGLVQSEGRQDLGAMSGERVPMEGREPNATRRGTRQTVGDGRSASARSSSRKLKIATGGDA